MPRHGGRGAGRDHRRHHPRAGGADLRAGQDPGGGGAGRLRRYEDVRLVFSPEFAATFFGGDPDNFNFPRHSFDAAFLRLYDDGRPARTPRRLAWTDRAPVEGEAVVLVGNPWSTQRLLTVSQL